MTEAMALERLLLARWELDGFWGRTRLRVPRAGNWPEIDVLAVQHAADGVTVRLGEVKARGTAANVYVLDERQSVASAVREWIGAWDGFLEAAVALYPNTQPTVAGLPAWDEIRRFELHFVVNAWTPPELDLGGAVQDAISARLHELWRYTQQHAFALRPIEARISTTRDLVLGAIDDVRRATLEGRGVRFADPFLDPVREIVRYLAPQFDRVPVIDGIRATRRAPAEALCRRDTARALLAAFGLNAADVAP